jgi:hypothetical protein
VKNVLETNKDSMNNAAKASVHTLIFYTWVFVPAAGDKDKGDGLG